MAIKSFRGPSSKNLNKKIYQNILVKDHMSNDVITFKKDDYIFDVMKILTENKISGAPVLSKSGKLVGMISETDIMKTIIDSQYYNMPINKKKVSYYMTDYVDYISPNNTIFEIASKFRTHKRRRFPVVNNGKLIGIISKIDLINASLTLKSTNYN